MIELGLIGIVRKFDNTKGNRITLPMEFVEYLGSPTVAMISCAEINGEKCIILKNKDTK